MSPLSVNVTPGSGSGACKAPHLREHPADKETAALRGGGGTEAGSGAGDALDHGEGVGASHVVKDRKAGTCHPD